MKHSMDKTDGVEVTLEEAEKEAGATSEEEERGIGASAREEMIIKAEVEANTEPTEMVTEAKETTRIKPKEPSLSML